MKTKKKSLKISQLHIIIMLSEEQGASQGKGVDEVQERQRRREIARLKEATKKALWFSDTFNVDMLTVSFRTRTRREHIGFTYSDDASKPSLASNNNVATILHLLYRFGVSDIFYHELSMIPCEKRKRKAE